MKKLLSVILALCLAVICMSLIGCDKDIPGGTDNSIAKTDTYYCYDAETDEYDDSDYMEITDTVVVWFSNDVVFDSVEFKGNLALDGKKLIMSLNGALGALDTCVITFRGERESDDVLRIDSTVFTTYSDFVDDPIVTTDTEVMYYCKKGSKPTFAPPEETATNDGKYYLYDKTEQTYDVTEYIMLVGDKLVVHFEQGIERMKPLTIVGNVTERNGSVFDAECEMDIKSLNDYMTDRAANEFYSSIGYAPSGIEFYAKLKLVCSGYIYDNAVRLKTLIAKIEGFTGVFNKLNMSKSIRGSNTVYCPKDEIPDYSVKVTFDMDGGTLNGKSKIVVRTDSDGKLTLPSGTPAKQGVGFLEYCYKTENGLGGKVNDGVILNCETTVLAHWMPYVTITYKLNSDEYTFADGSAGVQKVLAGTRINKFPMLAAKVQNPKMRFKGWFTQSTDVQIDPSKTVSDENLNLVYVAQWHSEQTVASYNDQLNISYPGGYSGRYKQGQLHIHFVPQYYKESHAYGGGSDCTIRLEKNGKPDTEKRYELSSVYYDISGYYYTFDFSATKNYWVTNPITGEWLNSEDRDFKDVNFYIEFKQTNGTRLTYYFKQSDLEKYNHNGYYHLFLHEYSDEVTSIW